MGYKNLVIKKIENFFSTTVNGIPPANKTRINRTTKQPTTTTTFAYYKSHGFPHLHRCRPPNQAAQASYARA